jgi:hypothetical protein
MGILELQILTSLYTPELASMQSVRARAHNLINVMSDEDLEVLWATMQTQFYDLYLLGAVQSAKENFKPGDLLTREEALALVMSTTPTTHLIP